MKTQLKTFVNKFKNIICKIIKKIKQTIFISLKTKNQIKLKKINLILGSDLKTKINLNIRKELKARIALNLTIVIFFICKIFLKLQKKTLNSNIDSKLKGKILSILIMVALFFCKICSQIKKKILNSNIHSYLKKLKTKISLSIQTFYRKLTINFNSKHIAIAYVIFIGFIIALPVIMHNEIVESIYSNNFQMIYSILMSEITFHIVTLVFLGSMLGWKFIFSIIEQPSILKKTLANNYIIFIVGVGNHGKVLDRFLSFNIVLGSFLSKKLIWFYSIQYPNTLLVLFFFPLFTYSFSFFIFYGYYLLSLKYPKMFGKYLINFFEKNASKEILRIIGLKENK